MTMTQHTNNNLAYLTSSSSQNSEQIISSGDRRVKVSKMITYHDYSKQDCSNQLSDGMKQLGHTFHSQFGSMEQQSVGNHRSPLCQSQNASSIILTCDSKFDVVNESESGYQQLILTTEFNLVSDKQVRLLCCKVVDTITDLNTNQSSNIYKFNHQKKEGHFLKNIGIYLRYHNNYETLTAKQQNFSTALTADTFNQNLFSCTSEISQSPSQDNAIFYFNTRFFSAASNQSFSSLVYSIELLECDNNSLKSMQDTNDFDNTKIEVKNEEIDEEKFEISQSSLVSDQNISLSDLLSSTTSNQNRSRQLNQKRSRTALGYTEEDQEIESFSISTAESPSNKSYKISTKNQPVQPKKNVVKNIGKAFRSFVSSPEKDLILMKYLNVTTISDLYEFRVAYKKHAEKQKYNNTFIKSLLTETPFKYVFHQFVNDDAWRWLEESNVANKEAHTTVLKDYQKAIKDMACLDLIPSLRSRKRPISKKSQNAL